MGLISFKQFLLNGSVEFNICPHELYIYSSMFNRDFACSCCIKLLPWSICDPKSILSLKFPFGGQHKI